MSPTARSAGAALALAQALVPWAIVVGALWVSGGLASVHTPGAVVGHVLVIGTLGLGLLVVALLPSRPWADALRLRALPLGPLLGYSAIAVGAAYALNAAFTLGYLTFAHGSLTEQAASKTEWAGLMAKLPLAWIPPLAIFVGIWEELFFRGLILGRLERALGSFSRPEVARWAAVALTAALFALGHGYQGVLGLLQTFGAGLALGAVVALRGSIYPAIVAHTAIDTFGLVALKVLLPIAERYVHPTP